VEEASVVVVLAVVDTAEVAAELGQLEAVSMVVSAAEQDSVLVDQDSVVVPSMEEWAVSSNVTMQIGTATGTETMTTSSTIGSLSLTTVSGLGFILGIITIRTTISIITDTMSPPIHIRGRRSVPSNRTWPGKVTIAA
jgi:hypothetical protein